MKPLTAGSVVSHLVNKIAAKAPRQAPTKLSIIDSPRTIFTIRDFRQPMALRMLISRILSTTDMTMVFNMPMLPTTMAIAEVIQAMACAI